MKKMIAALWLCLAGTTLAFWQGIVFFRGAWEEALEKNSWTPAVLSGAAFEKFVDDDFASLRATMVKSGMI